MHNEPTIADLEKLIEAFRAQGGSNAELSIIMQEIMNDVLPQKERELSSVFSNIDHPSIAKVKDFKKTEIHPFKDFVATTWKKRKVKYSVLFISIFILIFIILNLPMFIARIQPIETPKQYEMVKEVVTPETEKSAPLDPGEVVPSGSYLVIPKIGINVPIIYSNSLDEKSVQNDLQSGVAHYSTTANPGEPGNGFITGHSSNYWWNPGKFNYVFANLDRVGVGDQVIIYYQGNKFVYQATEKKVVNPSDLSVLQQGETPTLTLMTCTPPGTSWQRLIIKFDQISPLYKKPVIVEKIREIPSLTELPKTNSNIFLDWIAGLFNF
ncbi:MAG: sortase [bacterium]